MCAHGIDVRARTVSKPERYSEDVIACAALRIDSGCDSNGTFAFWMQRANSIFQQRLKSGPRSCLEPLAQVDKCLFSTSNSTGKATMDPRNVQALVTRFSLKDKRPRGAALACPYAHVAMCVLACARIVFLILFLTFCRNLECCFDELCFS